MKPQEFVLQLRAVVIDENFSLYQDMFRDTPLEKVSDPYWKRALTFFRTLNAEQQEIFFEVIRQIVVDTTANVLGVIDGVSTLKSNVELALTCINDQSVLSGELQDLFLVEEENA